MEVAELAERKLETVEQNPGPVAGNGLAVGPDDGLIPQHGGFAEVNGPEIVVADHFLATGDWIPDQFLHDDRPGIHCLGVFDPRPVIDHGDAGEAVDLLTGNGLP